MDTSSTPPPADRFEPVVRSSGALAVVAGLVALGIPMPVAEVIVPVLGIGWPGPLQRRVEKIYEELRRVARLTHRRLAKLEDPWSHDALHDVIIGLAPIAAQTGSEVKRRLLRNAIVNSLLPTPPPAFKRQRFVRMVDQMDDLHVLLLEFLHDPAGSYRKRDQAMPQHRGPTGMAFDISNSPIALTHMIQNLFVDYRTESQLMELVRSELKAMGLTDLHELRVACAPDKSFTTPLGAEFVTFLLLPDLRFDDDGRRVPGEDAP